MLNTIVPDIFPERLRAARMRRRLSQASLAKISGISRSLISYFEGGHRSPSVGNLYRLADTLDVSTDYLLGRVETWHHHPSEDALVEVYEHLSDHSRRFVSAILEVIRSHEGLYRRERCIGRPVDAPERS